MYPLSPSQNPAGWIYFSGTQYCYLLYPTIITCESIFKFCWNHIHLCNTFVLLNPSLNTLKDSAFCKETIEHKAMATRKVEEGSREEEDPIFASYARIWKRKHDAARIFTENRRAGVLSTLHEIQNSTETEEV